MGGSFDYSRIKHHPDKRLLHDIKQYFHTFVTNDFDAMKALQTPDYHMTDIRKYTYKSPSAPTPICHQLNVYSTSYLCHQSLPGGLVQ